MLGISMGEIVVLLALGAILLRPEDMPKFARSAARGIRWVKRKTAALSAYIDKLAGEHDTKFGVKEVVIETRESFTEQIDRMRREMQLEPFLYYKEPAKGARKTPTLSTPSKPVKKKKPAAKKGKKK